MQIKKLHVKDFTYNNYPKIQDGQTMYVLTWVRVFTAAQVQVIFFRENVGKFLCRHIVLDQILHYVSFHCVNLILFKSYNCAIINCGKRFLNNNFICNSPSHTLYSHLPWIEQSSMRLQNNCGQFPKIHTKHFKKNFKRRTV